MLARDTLHEYEFSSLINFEAGYLYVSELPIWWNKQSQAGKNSI